MKGRGRKRGPAPFATGTDETGAPLSGDSLDDPIVCADILAAHAFVAKTFRISVEEAQAARRSPARHSYVLGHPVDEYRHKGHTVFVSPYGSKAQVDEIERLKKVIANGDHLWSFETALDGDVAVHTIRMPAGLYKSASYAGPEARDRLTRFCKAVLEGAGFKVKGVR